MSRNEWIYSLRQSNDEEETIELFDNAGSIIIRRFVFKGDDDDMLSEEIHVKGGALLNIIKSFFLETREQIKGATDE